MAQDEKTNLERKLIELEMLLREAREQAAYFREIAADCGKKYLRDIDRLSQFFVERKRVEEALRESELKFRSLFDFSPQAVALSDVGTGRIIDVNAKFCEVSQYAKEELVGRTVAELNFYMGNDRARYIRELESLGEVHGMRMDLRAKDGTILNSLIFGRLLQFDGQIRILSIFHDLTAQRQLETQLRHAQKMEALGTLAGGIAHDFNNLLMTIQGSVSLMLLDMNPRHPHHELLKTVENQVQSGARLTGQLLGYARKGKYEVKPLDVNRLIRETAEAFGRTRKDIHIRLDLADDLLVADANRSQIEQVLLNLCVNAADAMPTGGTLLVTTRNATGEDMKGKVYKPAPGRYVLITCSDTGKGMDEYTKEHIFEPFFTTKERGRGTGLGLASVYGIVKAHEGYIDVESEEGRGTVFSVYLPASSQMVAKPDEAGCEISAGSGTILVVDDEDLVLQVSAGLVSALGYTVLQAKSGSDAVRIYRDKKEHIDLVILDMVMPEMGGAEAYHRLREVDAGVRVLLCSGYNFDVRAGELMERGCDGFIQKPFDMKQLSEKIREVLLKDRQALIS